MAALLPAFIFACLVPAFSQTEKGEDSAVDIEWTDTDSRLANSYLRLLQKKPEFGNVLDLLWDLYAKKNQTPLLMDYMKKASAPKNATVPKLIYAHLLRKAERTDEARDFYDAVVEKSPSNVPALKALAEISDQQKRTAKALSFYTRLVKLVPADSDDGVAIRLRKASIHQTLEQAGRAVELWNELLVARPDDAGLRSRIVSMLLEAGETSVAIRVLREQAESGDPLVKLEALSELERVCLLINDFDGASRASNEAMAILHFRNHQHRDFFERLVRLHERFDRLDEMERTLAESVIEENPSERSLYLLASFYQLTANSSKEEAALLRLVDRLPDNVNYQMRLAELQLANDRYEDAAETLDAIIARQETIPLSLILLRVQVDISAEEEQAAENRLEEFLKANPHDPELRESVIEFARSHYMDRLVEKLLRQSVDGELTGSDGDSAPLDLARFLHERGRVQQAREVIEKFVKGAGDSVTEKSRRYHQAALAFQDLGLLAESASAIDQALVMKPGNVEFLSAKAGVQVDQNEKDKAIRTLERIWDLHDSIKDKTEIDQKIFSLLRAGSPLPKKPANTPPSGPIKSLEQYRKMAAALSASRREIDEEPPEKLIDYFEGLRKKANRDPTVANRYRAGWWAFKLQNNAECYFQLSAAQKEAGQPVVEVEELLLELAEQNERPTLMARHLQVLAEADPLNRDEYLQRRAEVRFQLGFEDEAVRELKRLASKPESSLNTQASLARLYAEQGSPGKQVAVWENAYRKANLFEKRRIVRQLVTTLVEQGKPRAALKALMDLVERETDVVQRRKHFESQLMVAMRHYLFEWLKDRYLEAVQKKPFDRFFPEALGRIHLATGNHKEAFDFMKKAYYMGDENDELLFELGKLASKLGDLKSAIYYTRQTISRGEGASRVENWENLITMLEKDFRSGEAALLRKRLEVKFGQDPDFLTRLANFYRNTDRLRDAQRVLKRRANLRDWDVSAIFDLALNHLALGETNQALGLFESVIEKTDKETLPEWAEKDLWPIIESGHDSKTRLENLNSALQVFPYLHVSVKDEFNEGLEKTQRREFDFRPSDQYGIRLRAIECAGICLRDSPNKNLWIRQFLDREIPIHEKWWAAVYSESGEALTRLFRENRPIESSIGRIAVARSLLGAGETQTLEEWLDGGTYLADKNEPLSENAASVIASYLLLAGGNSDRPSLIAFLSGREFPALASNHIFAELRDAGRLHEAVEFGEAMIANSEEGGGEFSYSVALVASWLGETERQAIALGDLLGSIRIDRYGSISAVHQLGIAGNYRILESADEKSEFLDAIREKIEGNTSHSTLTKLQLDALFGIVSGDRGKTNDALSQLPDEILKVTPDDLDDQVRLSRSMFGWGRILREYIFYSSLIPRKPGHLREFAHRIGGGPFSRDVDSFSERDYEFFESRRFIDLLDGKIYGERTRLVEFVLPKFPTIDGRLDLARRLEAAGFSREAASIFYQELIGGSEDYAPLRGVFTASNTAQISGLALEVIDMLKSRKIESPPGLTDKYLNEQHARFLYHIRDIELLDQFSRPPEIKNGNPPVKTVDHLPYQDELIRLYRQIGDHESLLRVLSDQKQRDESSTANLVLAARILLRKGHLDEALRWLDSVKLNRSDIAAEKDAARTYLEIFKARERTSKAQLLWLGRLALHYQDANLISQIADALLDRGETGEALSLMRIQRRNDPGQSAAAELQIAIIRTLAENRPDDTDSLDKEIAIFSPDREKSFPRD